MAAVRRGRGAQPTTDASSVFENRSSVNCGAGPPRREAAQVGYPPNLLTGAAGWLAPGVMPQTSGGLQAPIAATLITGS